MLQVLALLAVAPAAWWTVARKRLPKRNRFYLSVFALGSLAVPYGSFGPWPSWSTAFMLLVAAAWSLLIADICNQNEGQEATRP